MRKFFKLIVIIFLSLFIIFFISIFAFPEKAVTYFVPDITQVNNIEADIRKDTAYITTKLVAKNYSPFSINMDSLKYRVSFFNKTYFKDKQQLGIMLKKFGKDTFSFSFRVPYSDIIKEMKRTRKRGDSTNFQTNLLLKYSTFFGKAELPIATAEKLKIPEPPEIEVTDVSYKGELPSGNIKAEVKVKVTNNSKYTLKVSKMDYTINVVQFLQVKGSYVKTISIKGNSVSNVYLPVEVEIKKGDKPLMSKLKFNDTYHYVLEVDAEIDSKDFIQEKPTKVKLTKEDDMKFAL